MKIQMESIGYVKTDAATVPRHWSVSDAEGELVIDMAYSAGLANIKPGQEIVVIFHFHKSGKFNTASLKQTPPHRQEPIGVFSTCSPFRPNPIGMSVLTVTSIEKNVITVKRLDMLDGTPILDIKPYIDDHQDCPSYEGNRRPGTP